MTFSNISYCELNHNIGRMYKLRALYECIRPSAMSYQDRLSTIGSRKDELESIPNRTYLEEVELHKCKRMQTYLVKILYENMEVPNILDVHMILTALEKDLFAKGSELKGRITRNKRRFQNYIKILEKKLPRDIILKEDGEDIANEELQHTKRCRSIIKSAVPLCRKIQAYRKTFFSDPRA